MELLRDHRGIYGIGLSEEFDVELAAWRSGVAPDEIPGRFVADRP